MKNKIYNEQYISRMVFVLAHELRCYMIKRSKNFVHSNTQSRVLHFILAQTEPIYQRDIEKEFSMRPSTASELLKKMQHDELIRREYIEEDNRKKKIILLPKALKYKDEVDKDLSALEASLAQGLTSDEINEFRRISRKIWSNMEEVRAKMGI